MTLNEASRDCGGIAATLETLVGRAVLELPLAHVRTRNNRLTFNHPSSNICPQSSYLGEPLPVIRHEHRPNHFLASALDPLLGIFTGALAFYLYEINPRTAPAPEQKLENLVRWKIEKYQANHAKQGSDVEWSKSVAQEKDK